MLSKEQLIAASNCRAHAQCLINGKPCDMHPNGGDVCDYPDVEELAKTALFYLEENEKFKSFILNKQGIKI